MLGLLHHFHSGAMVLTNLHKSQFGYYYYLFVVDEVECGGASLSLFTSRIVFWNITGSSVRVTLESPSEKVSSNYCY